MILRRRRLAARAALLGACLASMTLWAATPDFLVVVIDLAGISSKAITGAPERCVTLNGLARKGVTLINVAPSAKEPFETLAEVLANPQGDVLRAAKGKYSAGGVWVCAERAGRVAELAQGVSFFAPDLRHGAFKAVVERYGLSTPLGVEEWAAVAKLRARYGPELGGGENELAKLLTSEESSLDPESAVFRRVAQLLQGHEAACVFAVLPAARLEGRTVPGEEAARIDRRVGEIWTLLSAEPYRNRAACVYVSLACGAGEPDRATAALLIGRGFQEGMVVQAQVTTAMLSTAFLRVMGQPAPTNATALPEGIIAP